MEPRTYHLNETTTATPAEVLAAITDFGPGRQEIFGNSADEFLEVHELGADSADVTEGTGKNSHAVSWERLRYDWSDPTRVTMKVLDSNVWSSASKHTYAITPQADGTTRIDVDVVREGKNLKGRVLAVVVSTIGKGSLAKALHNTIKAIETRDARSLVAA
jgi:Polyketide cyclase / dehydrase and lipid transport